MPLNPSPSRAAMSQNIAEMVRAGHPQRQAIAAAYSNARRHGANFALGGSPDYFAHRAFSQELHPPGLVKSAIPGRTDKINTSVPSGSYILPADFVSHLGQGNTMAGGRHLDKMFHSTIPHPAKLHFARGGAALEGKPLPVVIAGGEYVLYPEHVRHADKIANKLMPPRGGLGMHTMTPKDFMRAAAPGDLNRGHNALDAWVIHERKKHVKVLRNLPGPKK